MSLFYVKPIVSLNTTTITTNIASFTIATSTTTTTTSTVATTNISDPMHKDAMDIVVTKIISLLILTILSVLCGILPLRLLIHMPHLFTRSRNSVDCFLCGLRLFSGGIYMATCFLHLMPDTREKIAAIMVNIGSKTTYAVPELLVMTGFYAVVFVEQIIQVLYAKAQESDIKRKLKRHNKAKAKAEKEAVQVFRSTLDEDVTQSGHQGDGRTFSGDEDEDDYDDNVLIDDEEELSFNETDSDKKSLDSATEVKESLIEQASIANRVPNHRGNHQIPVIPNHIHVSTITSQHPLQQHIVNPTQPCSYSEMGTLGLRTFSRPSLDLVSTTSPSDVRSFQNSGPPMIHTHVQQHPSLNYMQENHHQLNHQGNHFRSQHLQHDEKRTHQEQQPVSHSSSSPPPLLPRAPYSLSQQQHQTLSSVQPPPSRDSTVTRKGVKYPVIPQSPGNDSDSKMDNFPTNNFPAIVSVECGVSALGDSSIKQVEATHNNRDVDSGVFSNRRECENSESETRKLTTSREVSFDRISESSSVLQEIQVKRVVDDLTRADDNNQAHFRSIIYIMALSFHGIFEGMALGLQNMKSSIWALCFAIVVHRCVLAFKLGMDLCRGEEKQGTTFLCVGTFTLISTLGIIIGILISSGASLYSDVTVPEAILQSLATGTIFYIVFFDILFKVLEGKDDLKRVSCSFVGFSLMAIVFAITRS